MQAATQGDSAQSMCSGNTQDMQKSVGIDLGVSTSRGQQVLLKAPPSGDFLGWQIRAPCRERGYSRKVVL